MFEFGGRVADVVAVHEFRVSKIGIKATGPKVFQYFSDKDVNADYIINPFRRILSYKRKCANSGLYLTLLINFLPRDRRVYCPNLEARLQIYRR